ncbi:unnamed protein product [Urochloa humidicola]
MALLTPLPEEEEDEHEAELLRQIQEVERRRRRPPQLKMKLAPYAMYSVFDGAGTRGHALGAAYTGLHFALYFVRILSLSPAAGSAAAAFWGSVHTVLQCICCAATALVMVAFIRWYMAADGVYHVEIHPTPQLLAVLEAPTAALATSAEQLPPPPPEMGMC